MDIENMIRDMNRHMPVSRRTLLDYLGSDDDTYRTREGETCRMERNEIAFLADNCTEIEKAGLKLPVFIYTDTDSSAGGWKVSGTTEVSVISRILGKKAHRDDLLPLYYPDYAELRKVLSSVIFTVFAP